MEQALEQPRLVPVEPPSFEEAWEMALDQLRMSMKRSDYDSRAASLKALGYKEGVFRIGAVNSYTRDWCKTRLGSQITRMLEGIFGRPVEVRFTLINSAEGYPSAEVYPAVDAPVVEAPPHNGNGVSSSYKKKPSPAQPDEAGSPRKIQLQRAYGTQRARVIQPERGMFLTMYFFNNWLPLLGHSAMTTVIAARSLCYWNPMTGELRNVVETDMSELARRASVSVRTVKDVLNNELVKKFFLRYKVRRVMTPNGVRTAGIILQVRMDDPLTPEDQDQHNLPEDERWYTADFEDETED
jgi:hypothetical protein